MAGMQRHRRYRFQVLSAALSPPLAVVAVAFFTDLSLAWTVGLALGLGLGSLLASLIMWWGFQDTIRAHGWEW